MHLNITESSSEPLHRQIYSQIRSLILSGKIVEGEALQSIRKLAKELRVSVITVKKSYETLEAEGLIYARVGKGYFVSGISENSKESMALTDFESAVSPLIDKALSEGINKSKILETLNKVLGSK
jgi:GntR family transcriptional regulator